MLILVLPSNRADYPEKVIKAIKRLTKNKTTAIRLSCDNNTSCIELQRNLELVFPNYERAEIDSQLGLEIKATIEHLENLRSCPDINIAIPSEGLAWEYAKKIFGRISKEEVKRSILCCNGNNKKGIIEI